MSRARQAIALLGVGAVAAVVGFAGAASLGGAGDAAPGPAAAAPPALVTSSPAPAEAPASPAEPAAPPEAPGPPPPAATAPVPRQEPARTTTRTAAPGPAPTPAVTTPPVPAPAPPETETIPPAEPAGPPARALQEPAAPPTGVAIPPDAAPAGAEAAHRALATALSAAAPGSTEEADIRRSLALWRAYLAPGAPPAPDGRRATVARALRANAWWFAGHPSPRSRVLLRDADGVILTYRAGQGFAVNPVATTGRWRGLNDDVPAASLAATLTSMGVARTGADRAFQAWEYYDVEGDPRAVVPGASGMAQARVALLMAHAQAQTGDPRFARTALAALQAFTVDVDRGGVRSMVRTQAGQKPEPWYVERAYPGEDPWKGGALNGFMVTLLNLRGAAAILDTAPGGGAPAAAAAALAREVADRGAATLRRHLPDHDSGSWSYYGLLTPGRPWRSYLADLNYHCYHVRLLAQLAAIYPGMGFATTSDRWQGYVDRAGLTCPSRPDS